MQSSPIHFAQLEHMLLKDHQETELGEIKQRQLHFTKRISQSEAEINYLKEQQQNTFRSALWGFFVNLFSQAATFIPQFGAMISGAVRELGNLINPYGRKAEQASIDAQLTQLEATKEAQQQNLSEEHLKKLADNRQEIRHNLKQGLADMQTAHSATVQI